MKCLKKEIESLVYTHHSVKKLRKIDLKNDASDSNDIFVFIQSAIETLENRHYSLKTISNYFPIWKRFLKYAVESSITTYSPQIAEKFKLNELSNNPTESRKKNLNSALNLLFSLYSDKDIDTAKRKVRKRYPVSSELQNIVNKFILKQNELGDFSEIKIHNNESVIRTTLCLMGIEQLSDFNKITDQQIEKIIDHFSPLKSTKIKNHAYIQICAFFYFMQEEYGITPIKGFSKLKVIYGHYSLKSCSYSYLDESQEKILRDGIKNETFMNQALVLLGLDLGFRTSDISSLKITDIDFVSSRITKIQAKTGITNSLPFSEELRASIIGYIKQERTTLRPGCPYLFLKQKAPFSRLKTPEHRLAKIFKKLNIVPKNGASPTFHLLRRTLVHRLVKAGVKGDVISSILGHTYKGTRRSYLTADDEILRECALDFPELKINWEELL